MGRGNYYPSCDSYRMRYYSVEDIMEAAGCAPDDHDLWDLALEAFEETIRDALPPSFEPDAPAFHKVDAHCIASNGHVAVYIKEWAGDVVVWAEPIVTGWQHYWETEPSPIATHYLHNVLPLSRVWKSIGLPASVRSSAWTSYHVDADDLFTESRA